MVRSWHVANLTVAVLLAWAAYWAALPWLDCIRAFPSIVPIGDPLRLCTFGFGLPGFQGPLGWNLLAGVLYVAAARRGRGVGSPDARPSHALLSHLGALAVQCVG